MLDNPIIEYIVKENSGYIDEYTSWIWYRLYFYEIHE